MARNVSDNGGSAPTIGGRSLQDYVPVSQEDIARYREQAREIDRQARSFIRENPLAVVAGAVALGFVVGRLLGR